jgi:hypothetical protein
MDVLPLLEAMEDKNMGREDEIRVIAYRIWEEEGCCDGHDCEHWLKAEVIWQGKQNDETAATDTRVKSGQTAKQDKKDRSANKRRQNMDKPHGKL